MAAEDTGIDIDDAGIELVAEKRGVNPWLILGALAVVLAIVFGVRRYDKKRKGSRPAEPAQENPA